MIVGTGRTRFGGKEKMLRISLETFWMLVETDDLDALILFESVALSPDSRIYRDSGGGLHAF